MKQVLMESSILLQKAASGAGRDADLAGASSEDLADNPFVHSLSSLEEKAAGDKDAEIEASTISVTPSVLPVVENIKIAKDETFSLAGTQAGVSNYLSLNVPASNVEANSAALSVRLDNAVSAEGVILDTEKGADRATNANRSAGVLDALTVNSARSPKSVSPPLNMLTISTAGPDQQRHAGLAADLAVNANLQLHAGNAAETGARPVGSQTDNMNIATSALVRDQVVAAITTNSREMKIEITLDPPELGRVTIDFDGNRDGLMRVVLAADSPHTAELLRRNLDLLHHALERHGLSGLDLEMRDRQQGASHGEHSDDLNLKGTDANGSHMFEPSAPARRYIIESRLDRLL